MAGTRVVRVSNEILRCLLLGETQTCETNVPADVEVLAVRDLPFVKSFEILIRSSEFEATPEGSEPPVFEVIHKIIYGER